MFVLRSWFFTKSVLLFAITGLVLLGPGANTSQADPATWTVRTGDALSTIATRFGVTVDEIREWNGLEGDTIRPGQKLVVDPEGKAGDSQGKAEPSASKEEDEDDETDAVQQGVRYEIQHGDTLSGIAARFDTTVDEIVATNPGLERDRIRAGETIRVGKGRLVVHEVKTGDTLSHLAHYHRVSIDDIRRWNPELKGSHIRIGAKLRILSERPVSLSKSIGKPWDGSLKNPVRLPDHSAYVIRDRGNAWGTRETIDWIVEAFDRVEREFPKAPEVEIHDISDPDGGFLAEHNSHQSGRDADIAYFWERCRGKACSFRAGGRESLDVERTWALLSYWLRNDLAEAIFIDYRLQKPLFRYARQQGATRKQLHQWFQYPRGRTFSVGVIRHYPNHKDHMHVRFVCHKSDEQCEE